MTDDKIAARLEAQARMLLLTTNQLNLPKKLLDKVEDMRRMKV